MAERLYPQTESSSRHLIAVADCEDESRIVKSFKGNRIVHVSQIKDLLDDEKVAVVVAINGFIAHYVIEKQLIKHKKNRDRIFVANPYTTLRPCVMNDDFAAETRKSPLHEDYDRVNNLFSDEKSLHIFDLIKKGKTYDNKFDSFEILDYEEIKDDYYCQEDYWLSYSFGKSNYEWATVLDCGAYIGDSIVPICKVLPEEKIAWYAFEPVKDNAEAIRRNSVYNEICNELEIFECGVGDTNKRLCFDVMQAGIADNGRFSDTNDDSLSFLDIKRIDDMNIEYKGQLYIKMDIEGSEMEALRGAENTIIDKRPFLAICVYHRKNDIIDIPLYINSIVKDYRFYLRGGFHTILWAIPNAQDEI